MHQKPQTTQRTPSMLLPTRSRENLRQINQKIHITPQVTTRIHSSYMIGRHPSTAKLMSLKHGLCSKRAHCFSPNLLKITRGNGVCRQVLFQFLTRIITAMHTGLDLPSYGTGSYRTHLSTKARNHIRLAPMTNNIIRRKLVLTLIRPMLSYLPLPLNILGLSRLESLTHTTVKPTIRNHLRNHPINLPTQSHNTTQQTKPTK